MIPKQLIEQCLDKLNIYLDDKVIENLIKYWDFLMGYNSKINLISRNVDYINGFVEHIIDSVSIFQLTFSNTLNYLDVGTGAGLPGFALKLARPLWNTHLFESKQKKFKFLTELVSQFDLQLLTLHNIFINKNYVNCQEFLAFFDLITARAVESLDSLIVRIAPFIKSGGSFVAYQSVDQLNLLDNYHQVFDKCKMRVINKIVFSLPHIDRNRALLIFTKD
jgi:16S rRNA (guanine527-N7)-methyltransferase